jgi:predicted PurR-regulated permease PerM
MSNVLPPANSSRAPVPERRETGTAKRSLVVMSSVVTTVGVVTALYWLQSLFIPLAFGMLLAFVLAPVATGLQRIGLGRTFSVVLLIVALIVTAVTVVGVSGYQLGHLLADLPRNVGNVRAKIGEVRRSFSGGKQWKQLDHMWKQLSEEAGVPVEPEPKPDDPAKVRKLETSVEVDDGKTKVIVQQEEASWFDALFEWGEPFLEGVTILAFAGILAIFMLLSREDLRNRLLRLLGEGHLTVTTKAVDEASHRISRFLAMQALANVGYGIVLAIIMRLFGLEYALLGGFLAAILRYIPFVGGFVAALFPISLALAQHSSWWPAIGLVITLVVIEIIVSNVLEPWLFGKSLGVSIVAYLLGAAFWTFMWGGIGLVMSGPLTVCLAVIGKYVPQLHFLNVLLGDEPVLEPEIGFYQRLVAGDLDEAVSIAEAELKTSDLEAVYVKLIEPGLCQLRRDVERQRLSESDADTIALSMQEVADRLRDTEPSSLTTSEGAPAAPAEPVPSLRLLCISTRDHVDGAPLRIAAQELKHEGWLPQIVDRPIITSDILAAIEEGAPDALCLGLVPPGGDAQLRYILKRVRQQFPELKIFVCRLADGETAESKLTDPDDAHVIASISIPHLLRDLRAWHGVLSAAPAKVG